MRAITFVVVCWQLTNNMKTTKIASKTNTKIDNFLSLIIITYSILVYKIIVQDIFFHWSKVWGRALTQVDKDKDILSTSDRGFCHLQTFLAHLFWPFCLYLHSIFLLVCYILLNFGMQNVCPGYPFSSIQTVGQGICSGWQGLGHIKYVGLRLPFYSNLFGTPIQAFLSLFATHYTDSLLRH